MLDTNSTTEAAGAAARPQIQSVFSDGGVIGRNPSTLGGTWAWCHIANGQRVAHASGVITPAEIGLPAVTNNLTELLALLLAMESLPDGWAGTACTDSFVTLCRFEGSQKRAGIPDPLWHRVQRLLYRMRRSVTYRLLGGHPSRADLERGRRSDGLPVSLHNVFCDRLCGEQATAFRRRMEGVA